MKLFESGVQKCQKKRNLQR